MFTKLGGPQAFEASPVSTPHLPIAGLGLQILPLPIWILCALEDLNSGPRVYPANMFTHVSPQIVSLARDHLILPLFPKGSIVSIHHLTCLHLPHVLGSEFVFEVPSPPTQRAWEATLIQFSSTTGQRCV